MVTLLEGSFFEGPRWHNGRWWVSDFYQQTVSSFDADGSDVRVEAKIEGQPSGLGWATDGSLLIVSMLDKQLLRRTASGELEVAADLGALGSAPCNDMVIDSVGRAWIGNLGFDFFEHAKFRPGMLFRVDSDGEISIAAEDLRFPNGTVITPDGSTLIVGETFGARYTAFTIDENGTLVDRRIWAKVPDVYPDGCCLDAEGRIWCADANRAGCFLVEAGGRILTKISPPDGYCTYACMLGGHAGTTLLQCCAPDPDRETRSKTKEAILVVTEVEVPRAGLP
jgi:sugar lactone lactonase YvrE